MEFEDIDELMRETPVANNHGRKSNMLVPRQDPAKDGFSWPSRSRRDLSLVEELDFLWVEAEPGSSFGRKQAAEHGLKAHRGLLTKDEIEFLDLGETRSKLEEMLRLPKGWLDRAYQGAGSISEEDLAVRIVADESLLSAVEGGASTHWMARALGWRVRVRDGHSNDCPRMSRTLKRARRTRREHA